MKIYAVTLIYNGNDNSFSNHEHKQRCIGFVATLEKALDAVKTNQGDMHECLYNYVVVEEVSDGLWFHDIGSNEYWFEWDEVNQKFVECNKPQKYLEGCTVKGFSMG